MGVITLLTELIKCPSFTPTGFLPPSLQLYNSAACKKTLDILEAKALAMGFEVIHRPVFVNLHPEFPYPVENLILRRRKGSPKRSLCFLGHTDLFPTKVEDWSVNPFGAEIRDGYLYGRGATDMKGGIAAWFCAVEEVIDRMEDADIYVVITTDEEAMALNGTRPTLEWMYANGHRPTAFIVGEPSSNAILGDSVRPGRRGCMGGKIKVIGSPGHTAYPGSFINPSKILRKILDILDNAVEKLDFPPDWHDSWPTGFEVTSIVFSHLMNIGGIEKEAEAAFNLRFTGNFTAQQLADILQKALDDAGISRDAVQFTPRVDLAANPYNSIQGRLSAAIRAAIAIVAPGVTPRFNREGGSSDGRFVQEFDPKAEVIEFGSCYNGGLDVAHPDYGKKGGLHMVDERIKLEDLYNLTRAYGLVIRSFFTEAA